ncbi:hypothetical protein [Paenibacillus sp. PL91]|uniref:hypothetical protein n=1 Tax=Paenibacillus sp. PL91 TaxID=2729538 RepID=UPI00145DF8AA|nr:hypothetical protein [Paenibacillus sp. PL91]MBC9205164.1 hypothetical protein [Paenibacillus sp. PL91]
MPKQISEEEAHLLGIDTLHQEMDNGERRFRLVSSDGSSYIRTEASNNGGWQKSHYHKSLREFYVVQKGWLVYTEYVSDNKLVLKHLEQGESILVKPFVHHNLYMSAYTVTHVIKYGGEIENDWYPSPELDKLTLHLPESELARMRDCY